MKRLILDKLQKPYRKEIDSVLEIFFFKILIFLKGLIYVMFYRKYRNKSISFFNESNRKKRKNVFVFANGPSLGDLDFEKVKNFLKGDDWSLITVNSFASKAIKSYGISPDYCVFGDQFHYTGDAGVGITKQAEQDIESVNELNIAAFVPYQFMKCSKFKNSIPFCSSSNIYSKNISDLNKPLGYYPMSAFYALSLAINMGYENIYICGFDNSYFKDFYLDSKGDKFFIDKHFYDKEGEGQREIKKRDFENTSDVFLNFYRHFLYLEKINKNIPRGSVINNIAKITYTDAFGRFLSLDVYK